jgi:D-tyrosyl-tRNA(Tyr) deacylase
MRAVIQRVSQARVRVENQVVGEIGPGLLVLLGVGQHDNQAKAVWLAEKIIGLRIFEDAAGKMNLNLVDVGGEVLAVSQFTLYGDCRKGRRPGFSAAAPPETARVLYHDFIEHLKQCRIAVAAGIFQASMDVELVNAGPVTLLLDSEKIF